MVLDMKKWEGKVAVVTGASVGIGAEIVKQLVEHGLQVIGLARRSDKVLALAEQLKDKKGQLHAYQVDISKPDKIMETFKIINKNFGKIHILINNAGVIKQTSLINGDHDLWKQTLDTNVLGLSVATREEFDESDEDSVAVVRNTWLTPRKKEVVWPPVRDQKQMNKLLKEGSEPEVNWKVYPKRCFYETDDLDKATRKLKLSEVTSDLASECENEKHRIRKRPARYSSSDDGDDEISCNSRGSTLKRPPLVNISNFVEESSTSQQPLQLLTPKSSTSKSSGSSQLKYIHKASPVTGDFLNEDPNLRLQKKILSKLYIIEEQNKEILDLLRKKPEYPNTEKVNLQIKDSVDALEEFLRDDNNCRSFVKEISKYGGRDASSQVYIILKNMFDDLLAAKYSFFGKRLGKKPFVNLKMKQCIVEAVHITNSSASVKELEDSIKSLLKHASDRLKKAMKN